MNMTYNTTFEHLLENSIAAAVASIEVYNKPKFEYRNEIFVILIVNAWELLFKAKVLSENNDELPSIYVYKGSDEPIRNRTGTPLTIGITESLAKISVNPIVQENIISLIEIRDSATHFVNSQPIDYLVYSLGVACLKNYHKLIGEWFNRSLLEYSFYILPIGFIHHFQTFSLLEFNKEPDNIKRMLENITVNQKRGGNSGFYFCCEIETNLVSAKAITPNTDIIMGVNPSEKNAVAIIKQVNLIEQYPLAYGELRKKSLEQIGKTIPSKYYDTFLSERKIKKNKSYSAYNFKSFQHKTHFENTGKVKQGTPLVYNYECLRYIVAEYPNFVAEKVRKEALSKLARSETEESWE